MLGLILGDNLGLNTLLGFAKGFNATYFCRFCKSTKSETETLTKEVQCKNRTVQNYVEDVTQDNIKETGIHLDSIFNKLPWFHVVENVSADVMHDLPEGVCHYNMSHIIQGLIEKKYFTLQILNIRKQSFNLGETEIGNQSPIITDSHIKNKHLKMSAREMLTFVQFFPLMVGDLVKDHKDEIWLFFLHFSKMLDCIMKISFNSESLEELEKLVEIHNQMYVDLFDDTLKPKHHFLTHYARIIRASGNIATSKTVPNLF